MQSPSFDDHDRTEERSEFKEVLQQQQCNRDQSIQNSAHDEPLDLPDVASSSISEDIDSDFKASSEPKSLTPTDKSPSASFRNMKEMEASVSPNLNSGTNKSSIDNERASPIDIQRKRSSPASEKFRQVFKSSSMYETSGMTQTPKDMDQPGVSPIKKGKSFSSYKSSSKSGTAGSKSLETNHEYLYLKSHSLSGESKDVSRPNSFNSSSNSMKRSASRDYASKSSKSSFSGSAAQKTMSSADTYNKLKSEWLGNHGRRKSVVGSDVPSKREEKVANVSAIKQRSSLVVSKSATGSYASTIRQPVDANSDTPVKTNRLYDDAFVQARRRNMLRDKAEKEEEALRKQRQYRMPASSRKLMSNISRSCDDINICERLHNEASVISKNRDEKSKSWASQKESVITDWSCLECGTFNTIKGINPQSAAKQSGMMFTCTSCQAVCSFESIQESMFKPTNVAMLKGSMENMNMNRSRVYTRGESIHEYLHANTDLETKKLQLLKESWEGEDEVLTFRPIIPESSKQLLRQYKSRNTKESSALSRMSSLSTSKSFNGGSTKDKIVVAESGLESYLNLPPTERLSKAETLCRVAEAENQKPYTLRSSVSSENKDSASVRGGESKELHLSETKLENLFNRLTYEYIEKAAKRDALQKQLSDIDHNTGKKLFHPTIGQPPSTLCTSAPVMPTEKKESIYDKLLRKGAEAKQRALEIRNKVLQKEKENLTKNMCQSLDRSKSILQESSQQCIEEIYKLLLANQMFFQKNDTAKSKDILIRDKNGQLNSDRMKLTAEYLNEVSGKLEKYQDLVLDVRTIDPNLVVSDVQELLSDLRALGLSNASKKQTKPEDRKEKESESNYHVTFSQFKDMIMQCTSKRAGGVGRSYIYVPKPRDTAVKRMIDQDEKECTFKPTIDARSADMAKSMGRGVLSIEDILNEQVQLRESRMKQVKALVDRDEGSKCTFKPYLYPPPKNVTPTYRGQPRMKDSNSSTQNNINSVANERCHADGDDDSVLTASTCSTIKNVQKAGAASQETEILNGVEDCEHSSKSAPDHDHTLRWSRQKDSYYCTSPIKD